MTENNIKEFPKKLKTQAEVLPENLRNTESYLLNEVLYTPQKMKSATDFTTGNQRNRRWGIVVSFATVPGLDQIPLNSGPTLLPKSPTRFFTADSLGELKARVVHELENVLEMARLAVEEPEKFEQITRDLLGQIESEVPSYVNNDGDSDMS
jgi:hypothetical protein